MNRIFPFLILAIFVQTSVAWNNQGVAGCDGLFLLNQKDRKFAVSSCYIRDSLQFGNTSIEASYVNLILDGKWDYFGKNTLYSWTLRSSRELNLANVSVNTDYKYASLGVDVLSFPLLIAYIGWKTADSLFYSMAYLGEGNLQLLEIEWQSASSQNTIPKIYGKWRNNLLLKRFSFGSMIKKHQIDFGTSYIQTNPDKEKRFGYVFSDSSKIYELDGKYFHKTPHTEFSLLYIFAYLKLRNFGLLREIVGNPDEYGNVNEKRFFYLPSNGLLNLAKAEIRHRTSLISTRRSEFYLRSVFGMLDMDIPYLSWKDYRYYPTLAPNQALESSLIKTLSIGVFNRCYRVYGDVNVWAGSLGGGYKWDVAPRNWHLLPSLSLDFFYMNGESDLEKKTETSSLIGVKALKDSIYYSSSIVGGVVSAEFRVESPRDRFFADFSVTQLIPFYYRQKKFPSENSYALYEMEEGDSAEELADEITDNVSNVNRFFALIKNGFSISFQFGVNI